MSDPNFVILYVDSAQSSAKFYTELLGRAPVDSSPTFAMFKLDSGVLFGLWSKGGVEPPAKMAGGSELAFTVDTAQAVDATHAEWRKRGIAIAQAPTDTDFGRTFVGLDPDGHRLRVFAPR